MIFEGTARARRVKAAAAVAAGALLVALPPFLKPFPLSLLTQALIFAVFAMSLDVLLGYTSLPSLGHAGTFGVAAYAVAILATGHGAGFWTCLGAGLLSSLLVAAVFGLLAIRALGVYFLMITLALGMVVWGLAFRWVSLTQGDNGISGIPRPTLLGAHASVADPRAYYYLSLFVFALTLALLSIAMRSPFGMSLRGIRDSEHRMRALGYSVWLHKYLAFLLSGTLAGVAGVLWSYYNGFVSPADAHLVTSVEVLLMVALGGPATLVGPALGAGLIVFVKNVLSVYTQHWVMVVGALYICVILFAPRGILGVLHGERR